MSCDDVCLCCVCELFGCDAVDVYLQCTMDMPAARDILIGLSGVFLGVGASFVWLLVIWFRTCALAPALACGFAAHIEVGPGFDSDFSPQK